METSKKAEDFHPAQTTRAGDPDPTQRPPKAPERGAPPTYAAHARRKDVTVRVSVMAPASEPEELREHGYGHGV